MQGCRWVTKCQRVLLGSAEGGVPLRSFTSHQSSALGVRMSAVRSCSKTVGEVELDPPHARRSRCHVHATHTLSNRSSGIENRRSFAWIDVGSIIENRSTDERARPEE